MTAMIDMTGQRFGALVVVAHAGSRPGGQATWRCRCDCGAECVVYGNKLRSGRTRACPTHRHLKVTPGMRFGRLVTVRRIDGRYWECRCDCGNDATATSSQLARKMKASCGCIVRKHGHASHKHTSPTYRTWVAMWDRCTRPGHEAFARYGGRGIVPCARWGSFENFLADMGPRPPGKSLDRIDNDRGYEPSNCRWASDAEQRRNTSYTRLVTVGRETKCVADWAQATGLRHSTILERLRRGWSPEDAVSLPVQPKWTKYQGERRTP